MEEAAKDLYHIYGVSKGWKRASGEPMTSTFEELPEDCKTAWRNVAKAAKVIFTGEILMGWLASQSDMLSEDWRIIV